ncbi:hypothetical protein LRP49_05125 [Enterovibrio sp. ZSDZ35]|uniref:3-hydroxyacyl-[acyl-carrier-protein] dehydratase n=1 Tax=Enterovibrio qingdaonensis TaxID=2899818 RepID=A0ABT5QHW3_9GAMM|nr:hypothetical protein [Enterovibrio sp. ZSDZ35]MDD1780579.1 hypothetical protein [Enterovibrio sp. ZSDZ35]
MDRDFIDELRDSQGVLDKASVGAILPYGDAFLFVESVSYLTDSDVIAQYKIPVSSKLINAHFKHVSMMPGVLMGEALAQAGIVLIHYRSEFEEPTDVVASTVSQMRFKTPALPGDTLEAHVTIKAINRLGARLTGNSYVNGREVLSATFDLTFVKRKNLIEHVSKYRES